jgi:NSS family neurotransmitter:Na+ symporter
MLIVAFICARGVRGGIEIANKIRAPALLALLCILAGYSLATGDVSRGLTFAFRPDFSALNGQVILAAVGQAFFATGVGQGMIMAYGAYASPGMSLLRTSIIITASILLVSLLATLMIFPMVFHYGMNPAQGSQLVFEVLPRVFAEMPGGRLVGSLFFLLLTLAALMPATGVLEPTVAWLVQRFGVGRRRAVWLCTAIAWVLGIGSVLSFNLWAGWRPLGLLAGFADKTYFDVLDYVTANVLGPIGALLTSILLGWRIKDVLATTELAETTRVARRTCIWALRYLCPIALLAVFATALIS